MSTFTRDTEGVGYVEHVTVPDILDAYHLARGWVEVVEVDGEYVPVDEADAVRAAAEERAEVEQQVAELTGDKLAAAVKAAKIDHPSSLTADEKRAALVDAKTTPADVADLDNPTKES